MRRLILRRGDRLPEESDRQIEKFARGPICGLYRPSPFPNIQYNDFSENNER